MSGTVDYVKVVDLLTDTTKELNQPCVEAPAVPAVPAERTAEERKQDAAAVLRELLHELEGGGAAGAAAEQGASALGRVVRRPPPRPTPPPKPPVSKGQPKFAKDQSVAYKNQPTRLFKEDKWGVAQEPVWNDVFNAYVYRIFNNYYRIFKDELEDALAAW